MPITLGPIVLAACPGTGSFWLQQMLNEPRPSGLGLGCRFPTVRRLGKGGGFEIQSRVGLLPATVTVRKLEAWTYDRHAPGPATVTIIRDISEILRTWFVRFRKAPPPPGVIRDNPGLLHPGHFHVYLGEINMAVDYWGPDFPTWLDAYLANASGSMTKLLGRFTIEAKHILHQENLVEETITMLGAEGIEFDEQTVRGYPRLSVARDKPPWPAGYQEKLRAAG